MLTLDNHGECRISIDEAADLLSQVLGIRLSYKNVYKWCRFGCQNVKLEYVRDGRSLFTTAEAVVRFVQGLLEAASGGYGYFHRLGIRSKSDLAVAVEALVASLNELR